MSSPPRAADGQTGSSAAATSYYLVFASKRARGHQFWHAVSSYDPAGQKRLL